MTTPALHQLFDTALRDTPQRAFLHLPPRPGEPPPTMTLAQLGAWVDALEAELRSLGVRPGDRVLAVAENCPEHIALVLATSRVGAWSCGINARMAPGEVAAFAAKADARVHYYTAGTSTAAAAHGERDIAVPSALAGLSRSAPRPQAVAESGELAGAWRR